SRGRAQEAPSLPLAGERLVEAAERLDPDEVAEDEHVQRDLQLQLALDLGGRMRGLARLVVPDDSARRARVEIDPVDLSGQVEGLEVEPSLQLRRGSLRPERDLEAPRDERQRRLRLRPDDGLEVAPQPLLELAALEVGQLEPGLRPARDRIRQALAQEVERLVELLRRHALAAQPLRQAGEEPEQRLVRDRPAHARVDLRVHRLRVEQALDEPDRRAAREGLQLRHAEHRPALEALEDDRMRQPRGPVERAERALETALPALRPRERGGRRTVARREIRERPHALALRRSPLDRPDERRESTARRRARG